jgi:hypothetical protein
VGNFSEGASLQGWADDELYCVSKRKSMNPKIFCSLDFSLVHFFVSRQRNEQAFREQTRNNEPGNYL